MTRPDRRPAPRRAAGRITATIVLGAISVVGGAIPAVPAATGGASAGPQLTTEQIQARPLDDSGPVHPAPAGLAPDGSTPDGSGSGGTGGPAAQYGPPVVAADVAAGLAADVAAGLAAVPAAAPAGAAPASSGGPGIPAVMLAAYRAAAGRLAVTDPGCRLSWPVLAAIGRIESSHAAGGRVDANGRTLGPILGVRLDGSPGVAAVSDTDRGVLDGDAVWDRAVGPMQFIPATWRAYGVDGNGDGVADPHNAYDAAAAAAGYLCAGGGDLSTPGGLVAAILRYNHSAAYVRNVIAWATAYASGVTPTADLPGPVPSAPVPPPTSPAALAAPPPVAVHPLTAPVGPPPVTSSPPASLPPTSLPPTSLPPTSPPPTSPPPTSPPPTSPPLITPPPATPTPSSGAPTTVPTRPPASPPRPPAPSAPATTEPTAEPAPVTSPTPEPPPSPTPPPSRARSTAAAPTTAAPTSAAPTSAAPPTPAPSAATPTAVPTSGSSPASAAGG